MHPVIGEAVQVEIHDVDPWTVDLSVQGEAQRLSQGVHEEHQSHLVVEAQSQMEDEAVLDWRIDETVMVCQQGSLLQANLHWPPHIIINTLQTLAWVAAQELIKILI